MSVLLKKRYARLKSIKKKYKDQIEKVEEEIKKKRKTKRTCKFPKDIAEDHIKSKKEIKNLIRLKKKQNRMEYKYPYISLVNTKKKYTCCALTSKYERCRLQVKYKHDNINNKGEKNKLKHNVLFCTIHMKALLKSTDKKTLSNGFFFESDLYTTN